MPNWSRSDNFIKVAANRNYIGAKGIFDAFDLNLKTGSVTDTDILEYFTTFNPYSLAYNECYSTWSSLRSSKSGKTLGIVQLIELLTSTKAREWDVATQVVFTVKTPEYKSIFPHHRTIFQVGSVDSRITAINNLIIAIGDEIRLAAVKTSATSFALLLKNAVAVQGNQLKTINQTITLLDAARDAASVEMFGIYGKFVTKFKSDPKKMDFYFPVNLIQTVSQSSFTASLVANKIKKLFHRKLDTLKHSIKYSYVGTSVAHAYFTNSLTKTPAAGTPVYIIQPNTIGECTPEEMGYTDDKRYLHIVNTGVDTASIVIDIMVVN